MSTPSPYGRPDGPPRSHDGTSWLSGCLARLVLSAVFVGVVLYGVVGRYQRPEPARPAPTYVRGEQPGSVLLWDPEGGDPVVAAADVELVVGRMREVPGDRLFVVAFTGTGLLRTRIGPLGERAAAGAAVHHIVHDGVIVASEPGGLRLHDLVPGAGERTVALAGDVRRLCVGAAPGELFVTTDRGVHVLDPRAAVLRDVPAPAPCAAPPAPPLPAVADLTPLRAHPAGAATIVVGLDAGERWLAAVRLDPNGPTPAWRTPIPADTAAAADPLATREVLAGPRLVATHDGPDAPRRLTAIDLATGARLWDRPLRKIVGSDPFTGIVASEQRVHVVRATSVEVYAAATGELVATLGSDAYGR